MKTLMYQLDWAGDNCWDVFTKTGRYAGLIVTAKDGTFRHYYNSTATKGSTKKFATFNDAMNNLHNRREKRMMNKN